MFDTILEKHFGENLTEDAKNEISTLIEAAINEKMNKKLEVKEKELEEKYTGELKEFKENLIEILTDYLEDTFTEWFEDNKVNIVAEEKVAMAENMSKQILGLCKDNYIEIKEEDINVVKDLQEKVDNLTSKLNDVGNDKIQLKKQVFEFKKAMAFKTLAEDLIQTDYEKLLALVEDIEAKDIETFKSKVKIIKEKIITKDQNENVEKHTSEDPSEELKEIKESKLEIDRYLPKGF